MRSLSRWREKPVWKRKENPTSLVGAAAIAVWAGVWNPSSWGAPKDREGSSGPSPHGSQWKMLLGVSGHGCRKSRSLWLCWRELLAGPPRPQNASSQRHREAHPNRRHEEESRQRKPPPVSSCPARGAWDGGVLCPRVTLHWCVSPQDKQKATTRRKLINVKICNREQVNKTHSKMRFIVWIPYIKSQHVIFSFYKDLVNRQVFYALNFSFSHSKSHENSSVHYGKDCLESGTCCILLSVHCV